MHVTIGCPALCAAASPASTSILLALRLAESWSLAVTQRWVFGNTLGAQWVPGTALGFPITPQLCLPSAVDTRLCCVPADQQQLMVDP